MVLTQLYDPSKNGQLRIAGFMSGKGSNLIKILDHEKKLKEERGTSPFHVAVIFSDNYKSNASAIGDAYGIRVFLNGMDNFFEKRGKSIKDKLTRVMYEMECMEVLSKFECPVAAYAGYMRRATPVFVNAFLGVNVHPADLTLKNSDGNPKYRGDHAVKDAILAGERFLSSTTHIVDKRVDCGNILMVSKPLDINYPLPKNIEEFSGNVQDALKEVGDWIIFPKTLEYIADGRYTRDEDGKLYFDEKEIPNGLRLE